MHRVGGAFVGEVDDELAGPVAGAVGVADARERGAAELVGLGA